jgi:5-formyltetrahydrofolate cyclo-ligase
MRGVREALPDSACDARSAEIAKRLLALAELERAETVLAFASIRNEVRTQTSMQAAWAAGKRVALPRVVGDELQLHLVASDTVLVEGAFSVPEPPETATRVQPDEVDFALVPALAVDPRGYRIGYGGGYYDKLIPRLGHACTCALAYDFQLIAEVPDLPFDVAVDLVVTDERVIRAE